MADEREFQFFPAELRPDEGRVPERHTACAFLIDDGKLLLEERPADATVYPGLWDTPGGHLEEGETPEAALARELEEELGVTARRFFLGMVQDDHDPASGRFYRHFLYIVPQFEGAVKSLEGRAIKWFSFADALKLPNLNPLIGFALKAFMERGWLKDGPS